jgi:hypothetical protein
MFGMQQHICGGRRNTVVGVLSDSNKQQSVKTLSVSYKWTCCMVLQHQRATNLLQTLLPLSL